MALLSSAFLELDEKISTGPERMAWLGGISDLTPLAAKVSGHFWCPADASEMCLLLKSIHSYMTARETGE